MKKMITKALILSCLFLTSILIRANDTIPHGKWEVSQVTIEKNTDGKVETTVHDTLRAGQSFIPCPQIWEFRDSVNVVLHFPDGNKEVTNYVVDGNQITIGFLGALQKYGYAVEDHKLTLTVTHSYQWNQPSGNLAVIEEKWTVILKIPEQ